MVKKSCLIKRISGSYEIIDIILGDCQEIQEKFKKIKPASLIPFGAKHPFSKGTIKRKIFNGNLENKTKTIEIIKSEIKKNAKKYATNEQADYHELFFDEPKILNQEEIDYVGISSEIQLYINNPHYPCKGEGLFNKLKRELGK